MKKRIRLFLLLGLLSMVVVFVPGQRSVAVSDPGNACQFCIDECKAAFPNDPVKQHRCILFCECNPPALSEF